MQCCGRYVEQFEQLAAPDAESLMRSRYSAFALGMESYLLATWHPSTRPAEISFEPGTKWLGLEVREGVGTMSTATSSKGTAIMFNQAKKADVAI